jgi:hypothetical protein
MMRVFFLLAVKRKNDILCSRENAGKFNGREYVTEIFTLNRREFFFHTLWLRYFFLSPLSA